jgi:serine/threonine-protein kinase
MMLLLLGGIARADSYGAISYSPSTGISGGAWNYSCSSEAQNASVGYCGQADCKPVVWVGSGCAALAVGNDKSLYGWAWNGDKGMAQYNALEKCNSQDGGCQIVYSLCSF